jgi:hypothetical protein
MRVATFLLLAVLSVSCCVPSSADDSYNYKHSTHNSRKAARNQQKASDKYSKQQQKAMKKSAKAQRKALKRARKRSVL